MYNIWQGKCGRCGQFKYDQITDNTDFVDEQHGNNVCWTKDEALIKTAEQLVQEPPKSSRTTPTADQQPWTDEQKARYLGFRDAEEMRRAIEPLED